MTALTALTARTARTVPPTGTRTSALMRLSPVLKMMTDEYDDAWTAVKEHVTSAAPNGVTLDALDAIKVYVDTGDTAPIMSSSVANIKPALAWLGVEYLVDHTDMPREAVDRFASLSSCTASFAKALHRSDERIWVQKMIDLHERRTVYNNHSLASKVRLPAFDAATLAAEDVIDVDDLDDATVLRVPGRPADPPSVRWDYLHRETKADHPWLPADLPWLSNNKLSRDDTAVKVYLDVVDDQGRVSVTLGARDIGKRRGIVMAGGALERLAIGQDWSEVADIDLFVIDEHDVPVDVDASDMYEWARVDASEIVNSTLRALAARAKRVHVNTRDHVIDVTVIYATRTVKVQIIKRIYASAAHVIAGFDLDSCRLVFDGARITAHPTALRAWRNGWNLFDGYTLSTSALHRYTKKALLGFGALVLGVSKREIAIRRRALGMYKNMTWSTITIDALIWHLQSAGKSGSPPVPPSGTPPSDYLTEREARWGNEEPPWWIRGTAGEPDNLRYHESSQWRCMRMYYAAPPSRAIITPSSNFTGSFNPVYDNIYGSDIDVQIAEAELI